MQQLIIIGARGFGREISFLAAECLGYGRQFTIKGFLDDKVDALDELGDYPPILSSVEDYELRADDVFVCAIGDVKWRKHYTNIIQEKGGRFQTLIHRTSTVEPHSQIGQGSIISRYTIVSNNCCVGDFSHIEPFSNLGHDSVVGKFCHLGAYTFMGGYSILEDSVTLHPRSNILPRVRISENAIVGAGSVVLRDVRSNDTVAGVPARSIRGKSSA